ncbi:hypothetical protein L917_09090 [Phytophthora nicotianae]|uniref:PiggyBac transposable element-derived protein domain-containing protein n=1 Tax=Phytophthora nicotianae TaxID=4792 RepID=W2GT97_PHYNI|nr:hypothetical protein L915_09256 [Phytophthora nicotianae]ETL39514.1 hypothetical protein L916_09167 [Phytophthora nicotianae]ETL92646.1 hypothetical protein L917_09090 [Phytophthora nicotianae]
MSKKQQAELLRQEKKDKEARAIARAEAAALLRSAAKEKERARVAREEKEGAEARKQALADLKHKRAEIAVKEGSGDPLKKQKTSPHMDDVCGPDSDDNSGNTTDIGELVPGSPTSEDADVTEATEDVERGGGMNSDVEGDADLEAWYTESEIGLERQFFRTRLLVPTSRTRTRMKRRIRMKVMEVWMALHFWLARKTEPRERLEAASAKLPRNWKATVDSWATLTGEEMSVLAQDENALKKMRVDGWNFGALVADLSMYDIQHGFFSLMLYILLDESTHPVQADPYPGLSKETYGPTEAVLEKADSPLQLFFFFLPPTLWLRVASESNRYYYQHLNARVDRIYAKRVERDAEVSRDDALLQETKRHKKIRAEEIVHCIGLLLARMLCPYKRRFADHWAMTSVGAIPKGTFGNFMSKARFGRVMQNLHFTDNTDPRSETDRAWKVRSVVDTL